MSKRAKEILDHLESIAIEDDSKYDDDDNLSF